MEVIGNVSHSPRERKLYDNDSDVSVQLTVNKGDLQFKQSTKMADQVWTAMLVLLGVNTVNNLTHGFQEELSAKIVKFWSI